MGIVDFLLLLPARKKSTAMFKNKALWTTVGFLLIVVGFLGLVLSMVGVKLAIIAWIDRPGPLFGFLAKLIMVLGGFVLVYLAQTDLTELEEEDE